MTTLFSFSASVWAHHGAGAWHFLTLPAAVADEVRDIVPPSAPGFGSIPVTVTVGRSTWETSLFPDKASGSFLLPLKKDVRSANHIVAGDVVDVAMRSRQSASAPARR